MNADEAHRRAEALFKKEQQLHEAQQAMAEYQVELRAMREKTARLRALRLAREGRCVDGKRRDVLRVLPRSEKRCGGQPRARLPEPLAQI